MAVVIKRLFFRGVSVGAGGTADRYVKSFNAAGDWTLNGTSYQITVLKTIHDKTVTPTVTVFLDNAGVLEEVMVGIVISAIGDVTISVSATPDNRFIGKLVII